MHGMAGRTDGVNAKTALVRALWDGTADVYDDAIVPALSDAHHGLLRTLDPRRGEQILDLGCGTGRMAELVARRGVAVAAAVDLAPEMVARARTRLAGTSIDVREMDAQALTFAAGSFDAVVAGFSLMFCPDHLAALSEARRVLRPGGRLAMSVWGLPEECETVRVGRVTAAFGAGPLPDTPTGQSLGDPTHLRALLARAGFVRGFAQNAVWVELVLIAQDLIAWAQTLLLDGELARAEPKRLRYRLLHTAGRLTRSGRRVVLHLPKPWPWADALVKAFTRLHALPAPAG